MRNSSKLSGYVQMVTVVFAGELRRSATPAQFGTVVAADNSRYGELMKSIGMVGDLG